MAKQYAEATSYEAKLEKVIARLGVEKYSYNWDRFSCWIEFWYKGQMYRFEHSIENAKSHGQTVKYGSDTFAQVVLSLEDIARMTERGIYELQVWVAGMKALPKPQDIPDCMKLLGFTAMPNSQAQVKERFRTIAKTAHPDTGGNDQYFNTIKQAYDQAVQLMTERKGEYA